MVGFIAAGALLTSSGVAFADPTADEVKDKIEKLEKEYSELADKYNQAKESHDAAKKKLDDLESKRDNAEDKLDDLQSDVRKLATSAYTGVDYGSPAYLMGADGPEDALQQAADLGYLSKSQKASLDKYVKQRDKLDDLESEAESTEKKAKKKLKEAKDSKSKAEKKIDKQQDILDDLSAEERAQATAGVNGGSGNGGGSSSSSGSSGGGGGSYNGSASGNARTALNFIYGQIGDSYSLGANGPDVWDCSSLVQAAWRQAGVSLPRTTYDQVNAGTRVSWDNMQPGDLIFFYSGPGHVGMYVGNGKMVHASNPSKPVAEVTLNSYYRNNFTAAVRP
ncbi:glycoside hydrolase [Nocardiopsis gilva YIM 90087]|uniref:Glycoside hydrolase n=1 Tax=Nocardiopsis gilva YIM 90087 TaxID=1235441 RepID=A0A223S5B8_9ACTN|nr:glycoside hydrolase [Nocardiopsis gilva YIM 90087]